MKGTKLKVSQPSVPGNGNFSLIAITEMARCLELGNLIDWMRERLELSTRI